MQLMPSIKAKQKQSLIIAAIATGDQITANDQ